MKSTDFDEAKNVEKMVSSSSLVPAAGIINLDFSLPLLGDPLVELYVDGKRVDDPSKLAENESIDAIAGASDIVSLYELNDAGYSLVDIETRSYYDPVKNQITIKFQDEIVSSSDNKTTVEPKIKYPPSNSQLVLTVKNGVVFSQNFTPFGPMKFSDGELLLLDDKSVAAIVPFKTEPLMLTGFEFVKDEDRVVSNQIVLKFNTAVGQSRVTLVNDNPGLISSGNLTGSYKSDGKTETEVNVLLNGNMDPATTYTLRIDTEETMDQYGKKAVQAAELFVIKVSN